MYGINIRIYNNSDKYQRSKYYASQVYEDD